MEHPLERAAKAAGLTMQQLAERLGVTRAAVQQWKQEGRRVPAEHCPQIERLCGGVVRCEELNDRVDWAFIRAGGAVPEGSASDVAPHGGADELPPPTSESSRDDVQVPGGESPSKPHPEAARKAA